MEASGASDKKDEGNKKFAMKQFKEAIDCYKAALELIPDDKGLEDKAVLYSNMAAAYMQLVFINTNTLEPI